MSSTLTIGDTEYFTVAGAAKELGCSVFAVKKALERGHLVRARKLGNYNLVDRAGIERYRQEHRKPRKQRLCEKIA